jgi:hypothetical protein
MPNRNRRGLRALPEEVRQELTNLLTRLFLAHASADHPPLAEDSLP